MVAEHSGSPASDAAAATIRTALAEGMRPVRALAAADTPEWRVVAAVWHLAEQSGSPLAPALQSIAAALRELARMRERRTVLLAGPQATVRMVAALPILSLILSVLLGFDPVPVLVSPVGAALAVLGMGLLGLGVGWSRALQRRVAALDHVAGLEFELAWVALGGGAPASLACRRVVDAVDQVGAEWVGFDAFMNDSSLLATIRAGTRAGVPLGPLLLEQGRAARAASVANLERGAERLGVRVLVPLGVCVLPAFIVLGVLPVLLSMFGAV